MTARAAPQGVGPGPARRPRTAHARAVSGIEPSDAILSSPADTQLATRALLEQRAAERPLVLLVDDLHWAEPPMLDLVEHIADWSRGVPILLLCLARPELLDVRPGWAGGKLNATSVLLEPLDISDDDVRHPIPAQ